MSVRAFYQPKGRAAEYAPYAVNLYKGCIHRCTYCYVPKIPGFGEESHFRIATLRPGVLEALEQDMARIAGRPEFCRKICLLCFTTDPYQPRLDTSPTREAIRLLGEAGLQPSILTKGGLMAARDFDLLAKYGGRFGTTLTLLNRQQSEKFELKAAPPQERIISLMEAKKAGVHTWVSLEPVLDPAQALAAVRRTHEFVDEYRVGKWNYDKRADLIDWPGFVRSMVRLCNELGAECRIKKDLQVAGRWAA